MLPLINDLTVFDVEFNAIDKLASIPPTEPETILSAISSSEFAFTFTPLPLIVAFAISAKVADLLLK